MWQRPEFVGAQAGRHRAEAARVAAAAVHGLTASGAVAGLVALHAVGEGRFRTALGAMAVAIAIDAIDGTLARAARVRAVLAEVDGALLDNLVDYVNYAVVPAYLMLEADLLPASLALPGAGLVCLVAALQFAHVEAKSTDHLFRGFPSYWNVVVAYLLLLDPPRELGALLIGLLSVLSLVPVFFVYPTRTPTLRRTTLVLTALWGGLMLEALVAFPARRVGSVYLSLGYVVYYAGLSLYLSFGRLRSRC